MDPVVVPLLWQLATLTPFALVADDGTPVVEWSAEIPAPPPGTEGHPALAATGMICPPGVPWVTEAPPTAPPPAGTPAPPPVWPRCIAFPNAGITPPVPPTPARGAFVDPMTPMLAQLQIAGQTWRWVDPTDAKLEKPALAELTWTDSSHAKLVFYPPPPDPKVKPKKGEELPPPPPAVEVAVHLAETSRPPAPSAARETADKAWKIDGATLTSTVPMPPGSGVLAVLPAPEPPKPAPRPQPLKPGEPIPSEPVTTTIPGTWSLAARDCDRAKPTWTFHPLLVSVPAPPPVPPPAPKLKAGETPPPPPPTPVAQTLIYDVAGGWTAGTDDMTCADPANPAVKWTGVREAPPVAAPAAPAPAPTPPG